MPSVTRIRRAICGAKDDRRRPGHLRLPAGRHAHRKGSHSLPAPAAPPVTATVVLDLGSQRTISGMRFVMRNAWVYVLAKNVSIFACADAQGRGSVTPLAENQELPATSNSNSAFVEWPQCTTRYLKVHVNDSYQQRYPGPWMSESQLHWCRKVGLPTAGDGRISTRRSRKSPVLMPAPPISPSNPPDVALPRHRLERDWLYQDAGLDIAHVFTSSHALKKNRPWCRPC